MPIYTVECANRATGKTYEVEVPASSAAEALEVAARSHIVSRVLMPESTSEIVRSRPPKPPTSLQPAIHRMPIRIIASGVLLGLWAFLISIAILAVLLFEAGLYREIAERKRDEQRQLPPSMREPGYKNLN